MTTCPTCEHEPMIKCLHDWGPCDGCGKFVHSGPNERLYPSAEGGVCIVCRDRRLIERARQLARKDDTEGVPNVETLLWHDGYDSCWDADIWFSEFVEQTEGTVPMEVDLYSAWSDFELSAWASRTMSIALPEFMYEAEEMAAEGCADPDFPEMGAELVIRLQAVLLDYVRLCTPSALKYRCTMALTPEQWKANAGLVVDKDGSVISNEGLPDED